MLRQALPALGVLAATMVHTADAHGAVTHPKPRQSIDSSLAPWNGSVPAYPIPFGATAPLQTAAHS
jgi:hypothetical protein